MYIEHEVYSLAFNKNTGYIYEIKFIEETMKRITEEEILKALKTSHESLQQHGFK